MEQLKIKRRVEYTGKRLRSFDYRDRLGRQIGASAQLIEYHFEPFDGTEGDFTIDYNDADRRLRVTEPRVEYVYSPHATRNGSDYGALQGYRCFATEAERDQAIAKYFAEAEKRAAKIAQKGK
jgi:hypothetical protein